MSTSQTSHGQGRVCFPEWDAAGGASRGGRDDTELPPPGAPPPVPEPAPILRGFLGYQGARIVVPDIQRMEQPWPRCPDNTTRGYCYGSCSTQKQYSNQTAQCAPRF